jgi:putative ABC transport system permease protein
MLVRNLVHIARTDPGFRTERLLVAAVQLPESRHADPDRTLVLLHGLLERVRALPGVLHAGAALGVPMSGGSMSFPLLVEGRSYSRQDELRSAVYNPVTPGATEALGLRLVAGRLFTETDRAGGERVAILNVAAARRLFGDEDPLGRRVAAGVPRALLGDRPLEGMLAAIVDPPFARVVGVVSDTRQYALTFEPQPEVLVPYEQSLRFPGVRNNFGVLVHTAGDPRPLAAALRRELRAMDPDLPLDSVRTMEAMVGGTLRGTRFVVVLLGVFAGLALLLAALGIYGVVAWLVSQRTRELGIRLALGAPPADLVRLVVGQGLRPVLLGLLAGLGLAYALTRLLASQFPDARGNDPLTYAAVAALLVLVGAAACWVPARRASRVDPLAALRAE